MSEIFDALQKATAERTGNDVSGLSAATELLRLAENQAASNWEVAARMEQSVATQSVGEDTSFAPDLELVSAPVQPIALAPSQQAADEEANILSQVQSLKISPSEQSRLVCLPDSESPAAEAFRLLAVRLRHLRRNRPIKRVLMTSTIPQEGKSTVAANLACALAQKRQQKTLLLEGDVRRPSLSRMFGFEQEPGLCEWLQGDRSIMTCIYHLEGPGLWIMPAGAAPGNPLELLQSGRLPALMDHLNTWFDWIIMDSPPLLPLGDTSVWARLADGILLVTREGTTQKRQLVRGLETIERNKLIGAVMNCAQESDESGYYYRSPAASQPDKSLTK